MRRKVQTVSVAAGKTTMNSSGMRGFQLHPSEVDFGVLKEGCTYVHSVAMKNVGIDTSRFKIRQPPPSTGMKVLFTPGPVSTPSLCCRSGPCAGCDVDEKNRSRDPFAVLCT